MGANGLAEGIGYLLEAALIEASEKKQGLNHGSPSGVPSKRFDIDIGKVPQSDAVIQHKNFDL